MKITRITEQAAKGHYAVFVDGTYAFSLSEPTLLESKLAPGTIVNAETVQHWRQRSADDNVYQSALRYVAMRIRSTGEVKAYLERKGASPALAALILNKLSYIKLLDDRAYARAFVADRRLLRPTSRFKLQHELRAKHVSDAIIRETLGQDDHDEQAVLQALIRKKRKLLKFQTDEEKLIRYLIGQGFKYEDIKVALGADLSL